MKGIISTILVFGVVNVALSQFVPTLFADTLANKAFDFYFKKKLIDSALKYYQLIYQNNPGYRKTMVLYEIGDCLEQMGRPQEAENYYIKCLEIDASKDTLDWGFSQNLACEKLADLYYYQNKYREALTYFGYTKTIYKPKRKFCLGGCGHMFELDYIYKIAICYCGLNKKDSAVVVLAPFVFRPMDYYGCMDSLRYDSICKYFVSAIFELYGKQYVKNKLTEALSDIFYKQTLKDGMVGTYSFITFFNIKIRLDDGGFNGLEKDQDIPGRFSKNALLADFCGSTTFKLIMEEDKSISVAQM